MVEETVIVTRHQGLVDWLKRNGITGEVISHATEADIAKKRVIGNLPLSLASKALYILTVDYDCPPELRGQDISADKLDELGAKLNAYIVNEVGFYDEEKMWKILTN